ncbi:MAG: Wzz/FepE/Etk N-terminal domain-containing protein [Candidatus Falkowbacteria bacterium]|nr:Wzz/FepE/Etk N-terminal domain-containing protein [Candidatus Falkowbacteria bacterium]
MELNTLLRILRKRSGTIFAIVLIFFLLGLALTFSQPLKYRSKSRLLIIQNINADPYTLSQSNQYLSNLFSEVIYSSSFFDLTSSNSQFNIDKNYFSGNYKKQMKTWGKTVEAKSVGNTGIIEIDIYHQDPAQAKQISLAVNNTLMTQSFNYQGTDQNQIKFNVIDQPIVSDYPVKPNLIVNLGGSLIFGLIFSFFYLYLFPGRQEKLSKQMRKTINDKLITNNYNRVNQPAPNRPNQDPEVAYEKITVQEEYYQPNYQANGPTNLPIETTTAEDLNNNNFELRGNIGNILK